jgi:hypothetical protein
MPSLSSSIRLVLLAAAVLACMATSSMSASLTIKSSTPSPDETNVAPEVVVTIRAEKPGDGSGEVPTKIGLRTRSFQEVAGTSERIADAIGGFIYRFTPAAPLPPDSYVAYFADHQDVFVNFADSDQDQLYFQHTRTGDRDPVIEFSTVSEPKLLYAVESSTTGVVQLVFSEDVELGSVSNRLQLLDAAGGDVTIAGLVRRQDAHIIEVQPVPGIVAASIVLQAGIVGVTGVEVSGLPVTIPLVGR